MGYVLLKVREIFVNFFQFKLQGEKKDFSRNLRTLFVFFIISRNWKDTYGEDESPLIMQWTTEQYLEHIVIDTFLHVFFTWVTLSSSKFCVTKSDVGWRYLLAS